MRPAAAPCIVLLAVFGASITAQENRADDGFVIAPAIPAVQRVLDLIVQPDGPPPVSGEELELVRYGHAGSLERPRALDLPDSPAGLQLQAWDWLQVDERRLHLATRDGYTRWLSFNSGSHAIVVSNNHVELLYGEVEWISGTGRLTDRVLTAAQTRIVGRGEASFERSLDELRVRVGTGRFEIELAGRLVGVLGAGQSGSYTVVAEPRNGNARERLEHDGQALLDALDGALAVLLDGRTPDGSTLASIWEQGRAFAALYGYAHDRRAGWFHDPDVWRREVGEALRLLAAYGFTPPASRGM